MSILVMNKINLRRIDYIHYLRGLDQEVHLLCDGASFPAEGRAKYEKFFGHIELVDGYLTSGKVEQKAIEMHEKRQFTHIVAVSEVDLVRAGRLRERFGIAGQTGDSARAFRDKLLMKATAAAKGIKVPRSRRVNSVMDILEFIDDHGLPVVVKPVMGCGAVNTHIIRTQEKLNEVLALKLGDDPDSLPSLEIEEFVTGQMYHVDGYVQDSKVVANWPSCYVNACHDFSGGAVLGTHTLQADNPLAPRINAFVVKLLDALPTPQTTAFHAEVFHTPSDEFILCEIASRVGGPRIPDTYRMATGFDLIDAFIRGQVGVRLGDDQIKAAAAPPKQVGGMLIVPPRVGVLDAAPEVCPLSYVEDFIFTGQSGKTFKAAHDPTDFIAAFLLRAAQDEDEMRRSINGAAAWFGSECRWSQT